jgi:transposase
MEISPYVLALFRLICCVFKRPTLNYYAFMVPLSGFFLLTLEVPYGVITETRDRQWRLVMSTPENPKRTTLRACGALNPHPERVKDELFLDNSFFDALDLVQVKYEMLRRVQAEGKTVSETARDFGFSRPSFYQAQAAFDKAGLAGLIPKKRGPRGGHKLTEEVVAYLLEVLEQEGAIGPPALVERVRQRFGFTVHPRTIERALARKKKPQ